MLGLLLNTMVIMVLIRIIIGDEETVRGNGEDSLIAVVPDRVIRP